MPDPRPESYQVFGGRHSKSEKAEPRPLSPTGEALADERATTEIADIIRNAPDRAAILLVGVSDTLRTRQTAAVYAQALEHVFADDPSVHVIPTREIEVVANQVGFTKTLHKLQRVSDDPATAEQKLLVAAPLQLKEFSFTHRTPQSPEGVRWQGRSNEHPGSTGEHTAYTKYLTSRATIADPDGDLREWFMNKGFVAGKQLGPSPEQVAETYLAGIQRLVRFARAQITADRPLVIGFVGHSWDADALAVYLANNGRVDVAGYDRMRGEKRGIGDAELMRITVTPAGGELEYRGQTFPINAELTAETAGWDPAAVGELAERGIQVEATFKIPEERDKDRELIDADIYWVRYPKPAPTDRDTFDDLLPVEGKLYLPRIGANGELIQFGPGYPGGVAGRFEQHYAKTFVDAGYAFATIRHNGTSLTETPKTSEIMNSPERFARAKQAGERFIGGAKPDGYRMRDLVYEPLVLLTALGNQFQRVHPMGQSFGATSIWASVDRLVRARPAFANKLGNLVSIAGWLGGEYDEAADRLGGMKESVETTIGRNLEYAALTGVNIDTTSPTHREQMRADMREMARLLTQVTLPATVNQVVIQSTEDPLITLDALAETPSKTTYPGQTARSIIIHDKSGRDPDTGDWLDKQHSHLWIRPENLLRAVQVKLSASGPRELTVTNPRPKSERNSAGDLDA